jgi:predicted 3-demethylubiquinone-9 3-methyltransferase (glyoxalase superfamily)
MPKIQTFIWFDDRAEEAVNFYVSLFKDSKVTNVTKMDPSAPPQGKAMMLTFTLDGQEFLALNGGPGVVTGNGPLSLFVNCETQEEIDRYWNALKEGGKEIQCGWLVDRYGITWQIVPTLLGKLMTDPDKGKVKRVTQAMMKMVKLDIAGLKRAADQE